MRTNLLICSIWAALAVSAPVFAHPSFAEFAVAAHYCWESRKTSAFAGQYILTTIGCGASCILSSIIDARSGQVTWLPFTICCWDPGKPLDFRLDSSLLVVHGMRDKQEPNGTFYYAFEEGKFRLVAQPQK